MGRHLALSPKLTKTTRVQSVPSALINHRIFRFKGPKTSTKFSAFLPFPPINYTNYSREIGRKVRGRTYSFTRLKFSPLAVDVCSCTSHAAVCVSSFFSKRRPDSFAERRIRVSVCRSEGTRCTAIANPCPTDTAERFLNESIDNH